MRWVGIDEAGYGPNLGPLVMTAVIAESCNMMDESAPVFDASPPDLWRDLASTVDRAGGDPGRLWLDDSKAHPSRRKGSGASGRHLPGVSGQRRAGAAARSANPIRRRRRRDGHRDRACPLA